MKRVLLVVAWVCAGLSMGLICVALVARDRVLQFAHRWQERSDGAELAEKLLTPQDVLEYIAQHPSQAAIASFELGRETEGLYVNADRRQPAAAAIELLVLARYARAFAAGDAIEQERVQLSQWEQYWLPGADDGAHLAALHETRTRGHLQQGELLDPNERTAELASAQDDEAASPAVRMRDLVRAMIRYGDHAAADFLIARFGRTELDDQSERLGFAAEDALAPYSGVWLSWLDATPADELVARYRAMGPDRYLQLIWSLTERLGTDSAFRAAQRASFEAQGDALSLKEQAKLIAALAPRGTARSYAELMKRVASSALPGSERMRAELEWPIGSAQSSSELEVFAAKRGSMPGVLVSASYARAKGAAHVKVCAVFLQQLPIAVWLRLVQSSVGQGFEAELLQNEGFFALAKRRLHRDDARQTPEEGKPHHANARID